MRECFITQTHTYTFTFTFTYTYTVVCEGFSLVMFQCSKVFYVHAIFGHVLHIHTSIHTCIHTFTVSCIQVSIVKTNCTELQRLNLLFMYTYCIYILCIIHVCDSVCDSVWYTVCMQLPQGMS